MKKNEAKGAKATAKKQKNKKHSRSSSKEAAKKQQRSSKISSRATEAQQPSSLSARDVRLGTTNGHNFERLENKVQHLCPDPQSQCLPRWDGVGGPSANSPAQLPMGPAPDPDSAGESQPRWANGSDAVTCDPLHQLEPSRFSASTPHTRIVCFRMRL